jgi:hypothetical protein
MRGGLNDLGQFWALFASDNFIMAFRTNRECDYEKCFNSKSPLSTNNFGMNHTSAAVGQWSLTEIPSKRAEGQRLMSGEREEGKSSCHHESECRQ